MRGFPDPDELSFQLASSLYWASRCLGTRVLSVRSLSASEWSSGAVQVSLTSQQPSLLLAEALFSSRAMEGPALQGHLDFVFQPKPNPKRVKPGSWQVWDIFRNDFG